MSPKVHFIVSSIIGLIFGFYFKSYVIGTLSWLIGWLIDCDHLFDYFLYLARFKKVPMLKEFFGGAFFKKLGNIYVLAHGWEYLILFIIFGNFILSWQLTMVVSLSYFFHLVLDQLGYKTNPFIYFLLYRIKAGFKADKLCITS